ncbi:MAG: patatin family protein [Clostridia bacterium]|nr:patatin family protein [Clostridia bacterium]
MRGLFSCGVLDVFMENGIQFDGAAGISAGAVFGVNIKSRQIGRAIRYNKKYCRDKRYCSLWSLIHTGDLYGADFCYRVLPNELDIFDRKAFRENPMKFYIGATDIETGSIIYHTCTDGGDLDLEWMRASASMPLVSKPVSIDGHLLLDGGIIEPVPLRYMEELGYDRNVVILTQPRGYRKTQSRGTALMSLLLHRYPKTADAMANRYLRYNEQLDNIHRKADRGEILAIYPDESLGISRTENNPDELERVYQLGRAKGAQCLDTVRTFLRV